MKKTIIAAAVAASILGTSVGCGSTWFTQWASNPVEVAQTFEQGVIIVLNTAQVAWIGIQPLLPASIAAQVTQQYQNAVVAANHAVQILNDAITAAMAAQQTNPSFATLMSAVTDAIGQILAIVDQYVASSDAGSDGGVSGTVSAAVEAHAGLAKLQTLAGR